MRSEFKDDFDRCELVLDCLLLIANVRRYWISVDVTKNINTEEEIPNYSCIDLDVWMGLFSTILTTDIPLFCTLSLCSELTRSQHALLHRLRKPQSLRDQLLHHVFPVSSFDGSCVKLYPELFVPYFQSFSTAIWKLLTSFSSADASLKYQYLAVSALQFFSNVCAGLFSQAQVCMKNLFRESFQSASMLYEILHVVIVPNCMATEDIMDQFESQPAQYVKNYEEGFRTNSQRYAVANLVNSLKKQYGETVALLPFAQTQFVPMLMNEIAELLKGDDMRKDCAYHLFQYRFAQFPSILKSAKVIDDLPTVTSFIESVAIPDLMVALPAGFHVERDVADSAGGLRSDAVRLPGPAAGEAGAAGDPALRGDDPGVGGVGEGLRAGAGGAPAHSVPEPWDCLWAAEAQGGRRST